MGKIKKIFTDKRFIYGSGSIALVAGFVTAMVLINIIVGVLSDKLTLKADLTENKIYELSAETIDIIKSVNTPTDVVILETGQKEDPHTKELLQRYANLNPNIRLKTNDPVKNPTLLQKYGDISSNINVGSVIVDNGIKYRVIPASELWGFNPISEKNDRFQAEIKITSAFVSLSKSIDMKVTFTNDHGEKVFEPARQILRDDNIAVSDVSTKSEGFLDKYDMYIIISPKTDFTAEEIESLDRYLKKGKSVQLYIDTDTPSLARLEGYLSDLGVVVERNIIYEADPKRILSQTPYFFNPVLVSHPVCDPLIDNGLNLLVLASRGITKLWDDKNNSKVETLFQSSEKSFVQTYYNTDTNQKGPFPLSVMITRSFDNGKKGKLMVMGSSSFLEEEFLPTNKDFILGSINWQIDDTSIMSILPKSLSSAKLKMNQQDFSLWWLILIVFIPVIILALGFGVWIRRRHL